MTTKIWLSLPLAAGTLTLLAASSQTLSAAPPMPQYLADFPDFNPALSTQLPGDVDVALKKKLDARRRNPRP